MVEWKDGLGSGTSTEAAAPADATSSGASGAVAQATAVASVDLIIPVLNEAHVLEKSVETVRRFLADHFPHRWRVVIVDNGSTDGTKDIAARLAAEFEDVEFWYLRERGRGRALRHAWTCSDADVVCYTDVDLSTELEALPKLVSAILDEGYDVALASRLMKESRTSRSFKREVISRVYNLLIKATFFTKFSDAQCGFKAVSRAVVDRIVPQIEDESWFFDTELLLLAHKQGYAIKDVPVVWIEDDDSRVKIVRTAWDDIKGLARVRWLFWREDFLRFAYGATSERLRLHRRERSPALRGGSA